MAVSINTSGTQTAVIGTEHILATIATAGTYQLAVDLTNLTNSDTVELRVKVKALAASTSKQVFYAAYSNPQGDDVIKLSPPTPSPTEFIVTLKQTAGTSRSFDWAVYQY